MAERPTTRRRRFILRAWLRCLSEPSREELLKAELEETQELPAGWLLSFQGWEN